MTANRPIRRGITLIEMMVAMALSLGIMLILTESFKMALDFVRGAHSTGELMSQLNSAGLLLTRDLQADHFLDPKTATNGPKLSDQRLDDTTTPWAPPVGGFFKIVAPMSSVAPYAAQYGVETSDAQGFNINAPANRANMPISGTNPTGGHALHFTVILPIGTDASSFTANSGPAVYSSQAAEVAYFLEPMGKQTSVTAGGLPLYNLIRRQWLVAYTTDEHTSLTPAAGDTGVISVKKVDPPITPANGTPNTLASVANPANRMPLAPFGSGARFGEDIVVSNVLSFEVLADWTAATAPTRPRPFATGLGGNTEAPYDFLFANNTVPPPFTGGVFDTGNTATPVMPVRIKGLQITIRVYDPRVKTTRQNTWKFAM